MNARQHAAYANCLAQIDHYAERARRARSIGAVQGANGSRALFAIANAYRCMAREAEQRYGVDMVRP